MGVISVKEQFYDREADESEKEDKTQRTFWVELGDINDGPLVAKSAPGIPEIGTPHPKDASLRVTNRTAGQMENDAFQYQVTVDYSDKTDDGKDPNNGGDPDDPTSEAPEIEVNSTEFQEEVERDNDKHLIANSAGQMYNPKLVKTYYDSEISITFKRKVWNALKMVQYAGTVNEDKFLGMGEYEVMCRSVTQRKTYEKGMWIWVVRLVFHRRFGETDGNITYSPWLRKVLDEGFAELVQKDSSCTSDSCEMILRTVVDNAGNALNEPVPLDGKGKRATIDKNGNFTPVWMKPASQNTTEKLPGFRLFTYMKFADFGLNNLGIDLSK